MMPRFSTQTACAVVLFLALFAIVTHRAAAAEQRAEPSAVRLIGGPAAPEGRFLAGIEIKLEPGWKTYWHNPGPVGYTPRLDFSASQNLAAAEVMWPAPRRFDEGGAQSLGYATSVILPVRVSAKDATSPVTLSLSLDYGVCKEICVPATAQAVVALPAPPSDGLTAARLQGFLKRAPQPAQPDAPGDLSVLSAKRGDTSDSVEIALRAPPSAQTVDLFPADASSPVIGLPQPLGTDADGTRRFRLKLRPGRDASSLALVAVADAHAISVNVPLDGQAANP